VSCKILSILTPTLQCPRPLAEIPIPSSSSDLPGQFLKNTSFWCHPNEGSRWGLKSVLMRASSGNLRESRFESTAIDCVLLAGIPEGLCFAGLQFPGQILLRNFAYELLLLGRLVIMVTLLKYLMRLCNRLLLFKDK
jgi:hypothetical protein